MLVSEFDYDLSPERIAQRPADRRDESRLMVVGSGGEFQHRRFGEIVELLRPGDLLVVNDTRVIPARLRGEKPTGGRVEILLDRPLGKTRQEDGKICQRFTCLLRSSRPLKPGSEVRLPGSALAVRTDNGHSTPGPEVELRLPTAVDEYLDSHGEVPLPVYIRRGPEEISLEDEDRRRYQTVYASKPGAVAAPTAGLHFTPPLLSAIEERGVELTSVTLHVGPGTFLPVRCEGVEQHHMLPERYEITYQAASAINTARSTGRRVVAVGTTVVRAIEGAFDGKKVPAGKGQTDLFIRPGYSFELVDALLTNFHLPRSTLLMLVCAFASVERMKKAYEEAVKHDYRFYSYGDAMFITGRVGNE